MELVALGNGHERLKFFYCNVGYKGQAKSVTQIQITFIIHSSGEDILLVTFLKYFEIFNPKQKYIKLVTTVY